MEMISELFENRLALFTFNQDTIHNVVLAIVYLRLISIPLQSIYYRNRAEEGSREVMTEGKRKKTMVVGLITNFLLGSLLLLCLQPSNLESWLFTGWTSATIILLVIYGIIFLSIFLTIFFWFKGKNKSFIQLLSKIIYLLVIEFIFFSVVLWIISNILAPSSYSMDSRVNVSDIDGKLVAISQIEKDTITGREHGFTYISRAVAISSVDLHSGKKIWSKQVGNATNYIGPTTNGLLVINRSKEKLYFLDPATGDVSMTEAELIKKFPVLANNMSYDKTDFVLVNPNTLYFYGLDGFYYKMDFATNKITEKIAYKDFIHGTNKSTINEENSTTEKINQLYPELMEVIIGNTDVGEDRVLVTYEAARNSTNKTLAIISLKEHKVFWKLDLVNELDGFGDNENYASSAFYAKGDFVYTWDGRYQYKIKKENGQVIYQYDYKTESKIK
ncbi:PA2928 family protein [Listeria seeligeri]|uniref:PA2928 family protein n=1 Tax=Listeria seeligeri TaxID=1640 RepID=UPI0022EBCA66|nr:PA2928 family protein [Listeria seeligeri]